MKGCKGWKATCGGKLIKMARGKMQLSVTKYHYAGNQLILTSLLPFYLLVTVNGYVYAFFDLPCFVIVGYSSRIAVVCCCNAGFVWRTPSVHGVRWGMSIGPWYQPQRGAICQRGLQPLEQMQQPHTLTQNNS